MNKSKIGILLIMAMAVCVSAYAAESCAFTDFWAGVGGFVHNAMPWNWGHWLGK